MKIGYQTLQWSAEISEPNHKPNKILDSILSFVSIIFSVEYTDYEFEIFSLSIDARTNSLGGIASSKSMSLDKVYSLNKSHKRGKSLFSYGESYSGIINYFQVIKSNTVE